MKDAVEEIVSHLHTLASEKHKKGFGHFKIDDSKALGVKMPLLRDLAKDFKNQHELAIALWQEGHHESKLLATMIADPLKTTPALADVWVKEMYSWDICDQAATNLFRKTDFIWDKVFEWMDWEGEFERRAGFANLAVLTVHHKNAEDELFRRSFPFIEKHASDPRNFVKKAINWSIREMGKRRPNLHASCIELCYRLVSQNTSSSRWIAADALRELQSEKVLNKLKKEI